MKKTVNRSIRTHTLIYFMLLSLVLISLLWTVQEWFFSTQFLKLKQNEVVKAVENKTATFNPLMDDMVEFCNDLHDITIKNNLLIYYFSVSVGNIISSDLVKLDEHDRPVMQILGSFATEVVLSPFIPRENVFKHIEWNTVNNQQSRFLYLVGLQNGVIKGQQTSSGLEYDKTRNMLYYGAEGLNSDAEYRYFVYMEAVISNDEITINLFRFEFVMITLLCILLTLVFSLLLSQIMASPITKISKRAGLLAKGDYSVRFEDSGITELDRLAQTLNYAADEFGKTEQIRRDFIANISHDFRTPLTLVRGYSEMIRDLSSNNPQKSREHAQIIIDEAQRLNLLVEDIQKLSRLQSGVDTLNESDFDLSLFCENVIKQFRGFCEKQGFEIVFEGVEGVVVHADSDKISQVLYNLIGNAMNYTDRSLKTVWVKIYRDNEGAVCEVRDNGEGIQEDEIDSVWERYYRANQEKRNVVGSGLGLSIVRNILLSHKAQFGVRSVVGEGTVFWFKLPYESSDQT